MKTVVFIGAIKSGPSREGLRASKRLGFYTVLFTNVRRFVSNKDEFPEVDEILFVNLQNWQDIREQILKLTAEGKQIAAVFRADTPDNLYQIISELMQKAPHEPILVEEYLEGPQYLVEVLVRQNEVCPVAIIEQEILTKPGFVVVGYNVLVRAPQEWLDKLSLAVESILKKLGLETGSCHLELRLVRGAWKLVEINPRMATGAVYHMIRAAFGINLVEETVRLMTGGTPVLRRRHEKFVFTRYLTVDEEGVLHKVTGKDRALNYPGVEEVVIHAKRGSYLTPPLTMKERYAYVIATGDTSDEAKKTAQAAAKEIKFHLETRVDPLK